MDDDKEDIDLLELVQSVHEENHSEVVRYLGVHTTLFGDTKKSRTLWLRKLDAS